MAMFFGIEDAVALDFRDVIVIDFEDPVEDISVPEAEQDNIIDIDLIRFCPDGIPADSLEQCDAGLHNPDGSVNLRNSRINVTDNRELHLPHADIRVACSKGTYIRALARDLGEAMGSGAHLDGLRRTRTGGFEVSKALTITQATDIFREEVSE